MVGLEETNLVLCWSSCFYKVSCMIGLFDVGPPGPTRGPSRKLDH